MYLLLFFLANVSTDFSMNDEPVILQEYCFHSSQLSDPIQKCGSGQYDLLQLHITL